MNTFMKLNKILFVFAACTTFFATTTQLTAMQGRPGQDAAWQPEQAFAWWRENRAEVDKWLGATGSAGGWGFFWATHIPPGRPMQFPRWWAGRACLATFLTCSTGIAASRFFGTTNNQIKK